MRNQDQIKATLIFQGKTKVKKLTNLLKTTSQYNTKIDRNHRLDGGIHMTKIKKNDSFEGDYDFLVQHVDKFQQLP